MNRIPEALEACNRARVLQPNNTQISNLMQQLRLRKPKYVLYYRFLSSSALIVA